jgi:putative flippase GtrA
VKTWLRFNAVGIGGAVLQLASLWFLTQFLLAHAVDVEGP